MAWFRSFGQRPQGQALQRLKASGLYQSGGFTNRIETHMLAKGQSLPKITWNFLNRPKNTTPPAPLPSVKTDLKNLSAISKDHPVLVWFGHSSYFIHYRWFNILVDPVFCGYASPFSFSTKSFPGSDVYALSDFPDIDLLVLTHDHYDHLDYQTVSRLKDNTKMVCTSLGVGAHLRYWGWDDKKIHELGWGEGFEVSDDISIRAATARHFSGRSLARNKTLWSAFVLRLDGFNLFLGGDSGYGPHFKEIGDAEGPFDLAILEAGQYNQAWPDIHMMPEETVQAALDLRAKMLMPVHWGKFSLSLHAWDDSARRIADYAPRVGMPVTTPLIGEPVVVGQSYPDTKWWEKV